MGDQTISAEFAYLYDYQVDDQEDDIDITFRFPQTFDPKAIKIDLNKSEKTLKITIPNEIPIVCGKLFAAVEQYTTAKSKETFTISFSKEQPGKWPLFIIEPLEDGSIDPQSALRYFDAFKAVEDPKIHENAQKMVTFAMDSHFLPAVLLGIQANSPPNGDPDSFIQLLYIAAMKYQYPPACFHLGKVFLESGQATEEGIGLLRYAGQAGVPVALSLLGKLYSPLSEIPFQQKNAKDALELFEVVIKQVEDPTALFEAAKLYDSGLGCEKADHEKALNYYERAKKQDPNVPELPPPQRESKIGEIIKTSAICVTGAAAFAGIAYSIYKIVSHKK